MISLSIGFRLNEFQKMSVSMFFFQFLLVRVVIPLLLVRLQEFLRCLGADCIFFPVWFLCAAAHFVFQPHRRLASH